MSLRSVLIATACALIAGCTRQHQDSTETVKGNRRVWISMSAERGDPATLVEVYIDGHMICNVQDLANFPTQDKAAQVGYFPLSAGDHEIEAKAAGFKALSKKLRIMPIPGDDGVQNLHLHLERAE